ncbi:hypothetical protein KP79_PYT13415 [Mizuhopecten yessoensis]|uniref:Uncharacterized protein n=1 Tax=Mizuhopecten yessoensis TaxID=6573 RepID=A0A210R0L5_MIZYE|nr:hypothetical protein KP79_PYT13415 [Mizuhopecten yessoensis]
MESMKSTPTEVGGYVEEGVDLSKTPSISVNISGLNTTTTVRPDEGNKQPNVNSDTEEPPPTTVSCCKQTESNDAKKQHKDLFKPSENISAATISSNASMPQGQTENMLEDKETSKCNTCTSSEKLDKTIRAIYNESDTAHVEMQSRIEPDENNTSETTEPKDFLHLVNLDHQYLAASGMSNWKANTTAQQGQDKVYRETPSIVSPYTMVKLYNKPEPLHGRLRQILTTRESKSEVLDNEIQTSIPNAALIQKHFQDMLAMTSLHSIEEPDETTTTEEENSVPHTEKEEDSDDSDTETVSCAEDIGVVTTDEDDQSGDENIENKINNKTVGLSESCGTIRGDEMPCNVRQTSKSTSALCAPRVIERNMWSRVQRDIEDGLREDAMLRYIFDKLLQRWAEYLQLNPDKLLEFEQENAGEETAVEVIEMLEDKGRYVWQLLDEILNSRDPI